MVNLADINYKSTDNYSIVNPLERSLTDFYLAKNSIPHVYPFKINIGSSSIITIQKEGANRQDGSLQMWLSAIPLDMVLFTNYDYMNPLFVYTGRMITLWDNLLPSLPSNVLALDPNKTYYVNVKNMESQAVSYKLILP